MSAGTGIEWTEATWNVTSGCTSKSPGCAHCYAEVMSKRLGAMAEADIEAGRNPGKKRVYLNVINNKGRWSGLVNTNEAALTEPLRWKEPRLIFVNSMSDLFWGDDEDLEMARRLGIKDPKPVPFEFVDKVFAVMNASTFTLPISVEKSKRWHTYQVLTKRIKRAAEYIESRHPRHFGQGEHPLFKQRGIFRGLGLEIMNASACMVWPPSNVWLGTSCENQAAADERIPHLLRCPAAVRFLSLEPLLGEIDLAEWIEDPGLASTPDCRIPDRDIPLHWVIVGGESGGGARAYHLNWGRGIIKQCRDAGVSVFHKQCGSNPHDDVCECGDFRRSHAGDGPCDVCCQSARGGDGCERFRMAGTGPMMLFDKKGGDMTEWPEDLQVREMPKGMA